MRCFVNNVVLESLAARQENGGGILDNAYS